MNGLSLKEYEKFSAYLDGQLSPDEIRQVEEQIKTHPDWRLAIEELSATRDLLRRAPRYRAPRNFTISPEVARQFARKSWLPSFVSFRLSSAVAALSVIAALALQLLPGANLATRVAMAPAAESESTQLMAQPTSDSTMKAAESGPAAGAPALGEAADSAAQQEQPAVIFWGENSGFLNTGIMAFGRGGGGGGDGSADLSTSGSGIVTYSNEKSGLPMGGGSGDAYVQESSSGGGLVTIGGVPPSSQVSGGVISIPGPVLSGESTVGETIQSPEVEQPPSEQPIPEAQREFAAGESAGPILGLAGSDSAGEIIAVGPITNAVEIDQTETLNTPESTFTEHGSFWSATRIAQAALIGVAVLAAVLALVLRRRS
jgi:hypothetical protein